MVEYHVNDKWIEPKDQPTRDELAKAVLESAVRTTQVQDGQPVADVIVVNGNPAHVLDEPAIAANLLANVRAGRGVGRVRQRVPESRIAAGGGVADEGQAAELVDGRRGDAHVPRGAGGRAACSHLAGHQWIPFAEPAEGATALATGESGSAFLRNVERGAVVTIPMGPISRHWAAIERLHRRYDHDEIWLRLWDQLLYELVRGDGGVSGLRRSAAGDGRNAGRATGGDRGATREPHADRPAGGRGSRDQSARRSRVSPGGNRRVGGRAETQLSGPHSRGRRLAFRACIPCT